MIQCSDGTSHSGHPQLPGLRPAVVDAAAHRPCRALENPRHSRRRRRHDPCEAPGTVPRLGSPVGRPSYDSVAVGLGFLALARASSVSVSGKSRPEMLPFRDCLRAFIEMRHRSDPSSRSLDRKTGPAMSNAPRSSASCLLLCRSQLALTFFGDYVGYDQLRPPVEQVVFQTRRPLFASGRPLR